MLDSGDTATAASRQRRRDWACMHEESVSNPWRAQGNDSRARTGQRNPKLWGFCPGLKAQLHSLLSMSATPSLWLRYKNARDPNIKQNWVSAVCFFFLALPFSGLVPQYLRLPAGLPTSGNQALVLQSRSCWEEARVSWLCGYQDLCLEGAALRCVHQPVSAVSKPLSSVCEFENIQNF